jgi:hypothetical protein
LYEIDTYLHFWLAEAERRMILPVMIQDCEPPAIPAPLKYVDAVLQTEHKAIAEIAEALGAEPRPTAVLPITSTGANLSPITGQTSITPMGPSELSLLQQYTYLIDDWIFFAEDKWRAVNDSQLGWKPQLGRCNGWDEMYYDSFGADDNTALTASDPMARRFDNAQSKGAAAIAVASFVRDIDQLRKAIALIHGEESPLAPPRRASGRQRRLHGRRSDEPPIIHNPMIVDAD